jgi:hypothetical protein
MNWIERAVGRLGDALFSGIETDLASYFLSEYRSEVEVIRYTTAPKEEMDALRRRLRQSGGEGRHSPAEWRDATDQSASD